MNANLETRRHDLDWLRIFAILTVFLFHSTAFFQLEDWHVKNANTYLGVEIWDAFATRWMMPLFFIISGAGIYYAMEKAGGWWHFYMDKVNRLLIPLIFGTLTHISLQVYLERVSHGQYYGSYFEFLPFYFAGLYKGVGDATGNYNMAGNHLWYLWLLFHYCLIFYPLFSWFKNRGRVFLEKLGNVLALPGLVYLLLPVPHLLMAIFVPRPVLTFGAGGWGFVQYIPFLITGFVVISNNRLQQSICRQRWISLMVGAGLFAYYLIVRSDPAHSSSLAPDLLQKIFLVGNLWCSWSFLLAIFGFGMKHLTFTNAFGKYANEAVLPFYILHQTVLVCVGYFVVQSNAPDLHKWATIFVISFITCMSLYEFWIRRMDILRFLFGMTPVNRSFLIMRRPVPQVIIVFLFIAPIILAMARQSRVDAFFSDLNLPRETYASSATPAFRFNYPAKSRQKDHVTLNQVVSMKTPFGKPFSVSVSEIPRGMPLPDFGPKIWLERLKGLTGGIHYEVVQNQRITLKDGTTGYETAISWIQKDGSRHTTISVVAYKSSKCVLLAVDTWQNPKDVEWIARSLVFNPVSG